MITMIAKYINCIHRIYYIIQPTITDTGHHVIANLQLKSALRGDLYRNVKKIYTPTLSPKVQMLFLEE